MKILVAEDEDSILFVLELFLKKWGYEVVGASSGTEAWESLQQEEAPAMMILDWKMPGLEGVEICRELRQRAGALRPYIVILTAQSQKADSRAGLEAGADAYSVKPFYPQELQESLEEGRRRIEYEEAAASRKDAAVGAPAENS